MHTRVIFDVTSGPLKGPVMRSPDPGIVLSDGRPTVTFNCHGPMTPDLPMFLGIIARWKSSRPKSASAILAAATAPGSTARQSIPPAHISSEKPIVSRAGRRTKEWRRAGYRLQHPSHSRRKRSRHQPKLILSVAGNRHIACGLFDPWLRVESCVFLFLEVERGDHHDSRIARQDSAYGTPGFGVCGRRSRRLNLWPA